MNKELSVMIAGEAGQGMQTVGLVLCRIFKQCGFNIFANQDYMSRVRGGNNFFQLRVSREPIYTLRQKSDIVIALDKASVDLHRKNLAVGGIMLLDKNKFSLAAEDTVYFDAPIFALADKTAGSEMFINSVACGILVGITQIEFSIIENVLKDVFSDKSEEAVEKNIAASRAGYDYALKNFKLLKFELLPLKQKKEQLLMNGNEAIGLAAVASGCKFYSAYPMTPSTSIMNTVSDYAKNYNIVVEQAEDEIAAVNMVIGASFAGARSMTATSGGGFALMVEGLSLAAMTETPIVVVDAQRPAPATGFPTRTEQADLEFLLHAGHGEFARAVYSPGSIEEAFYLTQKAFNLADKYQIPALIMTDQYLADVYRNVAVSDFKRIKVRRYIISKDESNNISNYKRYKFTPSGISPRAVPSWISDAIYADSDEHTEEGHITEDASIRIKMVEKRLHKKMQLLKKEVEPPKSFNLKGSRRVLVGFGSTYGVLREIAEMGQFGMIHLPQVWPFPAQEMIKLLKGAKQIITVENNALGQLARLLRRETGIAADRSILKFDGRPFNLDYLLEQLNKKRD